MGRLCVLDGFTTQIGPQCLEPTVFLEDNFMFLSKLKVGNKPPGFFFVCFIFGIEEFKRKTTSKPILGEGTSHITLCLKVMKFHVSLRSGKQLSRKFQQITELRFYVFHGVPCFAFMFFFTLNLLMCSVVIHIVLVPLPKTFDQTTISVIAAQLAKLQFKRRRTVEIQHGRVHVAAVVLEMCWSLLLPQT